MQKILSTHDVAHELSSNKDNGFSYRGAYALAEYLEEFEESTGEEIELDTVAIRCDYNEYPSALECASEFNTFLEILEEKKRDDDTLTEEEQETLALEYLEENTQVITFDGGVIIQQF